MPDEAEELDTGPGVSLLVLRKVSIDSTDRVVECPMCSCRETAPNSCTPRCSLRGHGDPTRLRHHPRLRRQRPIPQGRMPLSRRTGHVRRLGRGNGSSKRTAGS
ncbi:MAG TPA: hypothetical protein VFZ32_17225 [Micromonosporaceae bacterium]